MLRLTVRPRDQQRGQSMGDASLIVLPFSTSSTSSISVSPNFMTMSMSLSSSRRPLHSPTNPNPSTSSTTKTCMPSTGIRWSMWLYTTCRVLSLDGTASISKERYVHHHARSEGPGHHAGSRCCWSQTTGHRLHQRRGRDSTPCHGCVVTHPRLQRTRPKALGNPTSCHVLLSQHNASSSIHTLLSRVSVFVHRRGRDHSCHSQYFIPKDQSQT
mmetsp:Transcript_36464/g.78807  ORF Transcript_36464/g.78807 Transcript_36464/m.78807 type:complete len:214 (-) Transcript_36464:313-954(-)